MQSKNSGLVINTKKIKENDLYIKILSKNDEIISGIVFGGNSLKKRSIYQQGNFIDFNLIQKGKNNIKSFNGDIIYPFIANIYNDKYKTFSILSIISILNKILYEGIKVSGLYSSLNILINIIYDNKHWLKDYCMWLMYYLKILGYEIDYKDHKNKYFNLNTLNFQKNNYDNTIEFPYKLFNKDNYINYESVRSLFMIFEVIFMNNVLDNSLDKMPLNFKNFKNVILQKLKN